MGISHDCTSELKQASLKITPARVETMRLFETHDKPVDAQHIFDHLYKTLGIDRVTVFRILNTFTEKGLLRKLEFGEGKARYELAKDEHHHIVCEQCGNVEDIADCNVGSLADAVAKKKGFLIKRHNLEFLGLCKTCLHKTN